MFPWSPEFAWDAGHLAFFGALYGVLAVVFGTVLVASRRALVHARDGRGPALAWRLAFEELPQGARACRHQLSGIAPGRVCANGFECRGCDEHTRFASLPREGGAPAEASRAGRLFHRGHTFVDRADDGSLTIGLDELALRLLGPAERIELPAVGSELKANSLMVRVRTHGKDARVLAPVDGRIERVEAEGLGFRLGVRPPVAAGLGHLLGGKEAELWAMRELERLQLHVAPAGEPFALADGGTLVADVGAALPGERYDALLGEMLLEP